MPGGRPSKYTPELLEKAWEYVNGGWAKVGDSAPIIEGLCDELEITKPTAYDWASDPDKEFSYVLGALMEKQGRKLLNSGLAGDFNPNIAKMMLTKHGYSDTKVLEHHGKVDHPVTITFAPAEEK